MSSAPAKLRALSAALTQSGRPVEVWGLSPAAAAWSLAKLWREQPRPILLTSPTPEQQERFWSDLRFFLREGDSGEESIAPLLLFPAHETLPFVELLPDLRTPSRRLEAAYSLLARERPPLVIATAAALLQPLPPREKLQAVTEYLVVGEEVERDRLVARLVAGGYQRRSLVEERGEFSVRGGVVDLFPPLTARPVRLEFWGDQIEAIREFDPVTQRSLRHLEDVVILPVSEVFLDAAARKLASHRLRAVRYPQLHDCLQRGEHCPQLERYLPAFYERTETLWDYLPEDTLLVFWEPEQVALEWDRYLQTLEPLPGFAAPRKPDPAALAARFPVVQMRILPIASDLTALTTGFHFPVEDNRSLAAELAQEAGEGGRVSKALAGRLRQWLQEGFQVTLVCRSRTQAERLAQLLEDHGVPLALQAAPYPPASQAVRLCWNGLSAGFRWLQEAVIFLTEEEVLGAPRRAPQRRRPQPLEFLTSLHDLKAGDLVVHLDHGIGRYRGLVKLAVGQEVNDFLCLEYLGGDKLYLPVDRLHLVHKYLGVDDTVPPLDRLGGKNWERTKKRVRKAVEKIARELVELYAARKVLPGHQFSPPDPLFREFEATFPYEETPDQLAAIQEVLADMASDRPMDRLICGDVGYGKTEVALRAAFKAAMDGKQVAFLVPTTVLAEQHYETFAERLRPYPLVVQVLSRFKTPAEQRAILADLAAGKIDIIIGTHRLLQKDVQFKDLGLLIIDEEQRFGVSQKEKLKKLRQTVDVLTLTATPIPRTLQMALTGIREMSLINTPPAERQAVKTYIIRPNDKVIREAIRRELARGGQVFFVHNRVQNLDSYRQYLQRLVPEARIAMAHGQMPERELEEVMRRVWRHEVDVLVCTAIIEAGLDIPAANTIIINRAHALGLAQIYQLRGRVGRSREQAYAYLLVPEEEHLNPEAQKRLKALMEFTELGSGFKIALHDLQIRGAGNLLGAAQSGHIAEVGYELYLQLLEEEIQRLKGEPPKEKVDPELHLPVAAYLPETYVPDIDQRLLFYRRLSGPLSEGEIRALAEELRDCYGPLPVEAENLLELVRAKVRLRHLGIKRLDISNGLVSISFLPTAGIDRERLLAKVLREPQRFRLTPDNQIRIVMPAPAEPLAKLKKCLQELEDFVKGELNTSQPPPLL